MFTSLVTIEVSILVTPDFVDLFFVGAHQQLRVLHIAKMVLHFFRERSNMITCAQVIYW